MNQTYFHKISICFVLLAVLQLIGCSTTGTGGSSGSNKPPSTTPQITNFSATPATVNIGQTATINWVTTNAASVSISPAVQPTSGTGALPVTGSGSATITATTTFTLTATSSSGATAIQTLTVTATADPIVPQITQFSASPTSTR